MIMAMMLCLDENFICLSTERRALAEAGKEDLKMVWEASTRWNVEGKIIEREILWTEEQEEPDTRVGWEIIEDLQGQAQPWCQRLIEDFDLPDKTLSNMELKGSSEVDEEEEDSDEELERSLAAEAFEEEQAQLEEQVIIVIKLRVGGFPKNRVFPKRLRRCWKFCRLSKRGKTRKRVHRK